MIITSRSKRTRIFGMVEKTWSKSLKSDLYFQRLLSLTGFRRRDSFRFRSKLEGTRKFLHKNTSEVVKLQWQKESEKRRRKQEVWYDWWVSSATMTNFFERQIFGTVLGRKKRGVERRNKWNLCKKTHYKYKFNSVPNNTCNQQLARNAVDPACKDLLFFVFVLVTFWSLGTLIHFSHYLVTPTLISIHLLHFFYLNRITFQHSSPSYRKIPLLCLLHSPLHDSCQVLCHEEVMKER